MLANQEHGKRLSFEQHNGFPVPKHWNMGLYPKELHARPDTPIVATQAEVMQMITLMSSQITAWQTHHPEATPDKVVVAVLGKGAAWTADKILSMHQLSDLPPQVLSISHLLTPLPEVLEAQGVSNLGYRGLPEDLTALIERPNLIVIDGVMDTGRTIHGAMSLLEGLRASRGDQFGGPEHTRYTGIAVLVNKSGHRGLKPMFHTNLATEPFIHESSIVEMVACGATLSHQIRVIGAGMDFLANPMPEEEQRSLPFLRLATASLPQG